MLESRQARGENFEGNIQFPAHKDLICVDFADGKAGKTDITAQLFDFSRF